MTDLIDISLPLEASLPVWPGSAGFELKRSADIGCGDMCTNSVLKMDVHVGTHIDAPVHFLQNTKGIDELSLDVLVGPCFVADLTKLEGNGITAEVLESLDLAPTVTRLLFKTRNSEQWKSKAGKFFENFVAVTADGAKWLADRDIKLVGVDYLSVQRFKDDPTTHRVLLGKEVVVVEGLDLSKAKAGHYQLICLPIKLVGADGAPARVVLQCL